MTADKQLRIRISEEDKKIIHEVAKHLQRSDADAIRFVFREVYSTLKEEEKEKAKGNELPILPARD